MNEWISDMGVAEWGCVLVNPRLGGRTVNGCCLVSERSQVQTQGLQTLTSAYSGAHKS